MVTRAASHMVSQIPNTQNSSPNIQNLNRCDGDQHHNEPEYRHSCASGCVHCPVPEFLVIRLHGILTIFALPYLLGCLEWIERWVHPPLVFQRFLLLGMERKRWRERRKYIEIKHYTISYFIYLLRWCWSWLRILILYKKFTELNSHWNPNQAHRSLLLSLSGYPCD